MPTTYQRGQNVPGAEVIGSPLLVGGLLTPTSGIQAGGGQPTVAALTPTGTVSSIGSQVGTDMAGSFVLTAGTASTTGGTQISVTFATPLPSAPAAVNVNVADTTAGATTTLAWGSLGWSTTLFYIFGGATTANHTYLVSYSVVRQT